MGMRIAVTGGLGFIGTEIVAEALRNGMEVIVVDFSGQINALERNRYPILDQIYQNLPNCVSLIEPWDFPSLIERESPQVIVHAGAVVDTKDLGSPTLMSLNLRYTEDLARAASEAGAHLVFCSSAAVYGRSRHPVNPYGLTKAMGETAVARMKTRTASLRYFNVFGRNEHHKGEMASVPFRLARSYRSGDPFDLHSPDAMRDFVPVSTVAAVTVRVTNDLMGPISDDYYRQSMAYHRTYDVGTGVATSFRDLDNFVMQAVGRTTSIVREVPMPPELEGRYQGYTCAGGYGIPRLGDGKATREGLEEMYGR